MKVFIIAAASLALFAAPALAQDKMSVKPGQWMTKSTVSMSMMPQPQVHEESTCITPEDATFDPEKLMDESSECTIESIEQSSREMSFTMTCVVEGGLPMTGEGQFETDESRETMTGTMVFNGEIPGMNTPLEMTVDMTARRTGECES